MRAHWVVVGALLGGCVFTTRPMIPGDPADTENRTDAGAVARADSPAPNFDSGVLAPSDAGAPLDRAPPAEDASVPGADGASTGTPEAGGFADAPAIFDAPAIDVPAIDGGGAADAGAPMDCGAADGGDGGRCADDASDAEVDAAAGDVDATTDDGGDASDGAADADVDAARS